MEIFHVDGLYYTYKGGRKALDGISLKVAGGESLTVIGSNGSGKSTLLYILDGLLEPECGTVRAFGKPLDGSREFRQRVSLLFQNPQVQLFSLSVWDELCFGPSQLGLDPGEIEKRARDILRLMGIDHLRERGPWDLSGGEMKKVALGACLSTNPDVILLDEPTSGLDPRSQVELIDLIIRLRDAGKTIVTATHDLGIIQDISDRTVVIGEDHRIMTEGAPWDVIRDTDALLNANLIYKRPHRHSWYAHEHSSSGLHDHEHIPGTVEVATPKKPVGDGLRPGSLNDIDKLKILLGHWIEHNREHAETYERWTEKIRALGMQDLAETLKEVTEETKKTDVLLEKARKTMERG